MIFIHKIRAFSLAVSVCIITFAAGCASARQPVPPGVVPQQSSVYSEDEQYGHEVFNQLTKSYPVDRSDDNVNRIRDIVDKLVKAARADHNPWHVYVLVGDDIKNAAATRGNFIFVWSGILKTATSDAEIATVLAHEIGHVLAGHTAPDPAEETQRIIAGVAGTVTGSVLATRGVAGPVADLAEIVVRASLEALIVNPNQQANELEADQIGIFMMADASYDPAEAITFWERAQHDPAFGSLPFEFMSSHPSSSTRLERLRGLLPQAQERYAAASGSAVPSAYAMNSARGDYRSDHKRAANDEVWIVQERETVVYSGPDNGSKVIDKLAFNSEVSVRSIRGRWLEITTPVGGFVRSRDLAPK
ncbi:MAG: M48 family metalloprotease [Deltaproteobacteria bacterium]|nr:M48 family metalloprotease [Deltaproteobacteria bacterium]